MSPLGLAEAERFLDSLGLPSDRTWVQLKGGANNRVFHVRAAATHLVLKHYFREDPGERAAAEYGFLDYAWSAGLRCVPQPLGADSGGRFVAMRFVEGRPLAEAEIPDRHWEQCLDFLAGLESARGSAAAARLGGAAESCRSIEEHLKLIDARVARLGSAAVEGDLAPRLRSAVAAIGAAWSAVAAGVRDRANGPERRLADAERCVSPSDFGFHNALRTDSGRLCFLDFEYAGWDDPAKLLCDFFCQPRVPAPRAWESRAVGAIAALRADFRSAEERFRLLLPAYQIKWACIALNDFLPHGAARREFALGDGGRGSRLGAQLETAEDFLASATGARRLGGDS